MILPLTTRSCPCTEWFVCDSLVCVTQIIYEVTHCP
jgi:hypothetical protein